MTDLAYLTVAEGAQLLRRKKLSPVEWTKALLDRIAAIDSNYNSIDHRTLLEAAFGDCDPLPAAIRAHVSKRDFSIPHHRILVCGESVSTGIGLTVYAMGGGMADSGEYMTQRIEYRATLATTEQRAKADLAVFREFLSSLELGSGTD